MKTRPYQDEARAAIYDSLRKHRSTLLVLPTGTGKTVVFASIVGDGVRRGRRVLVLAHRAELIEQGASKIAAVAGCEVGIEMADQRDGSRGGALIGQAPVLMASVQSIARRLDSFPRDAFNLVIVDECFPAGTLVDGRPIESIRVGDIVTAFDHVADEIVERRVVRLFAKHPSALVKLTTASGRAITCTPGHPFYVPGSGYVEALYCAGLVLVCDDGTEDKVERVESVAFGFDAVRACSDGLVYNLEVEGTHNYFANGVLVHNCHHATAETYRKILDHFDSAKILGVTATPNRGDNVALKAVFEDVAFDLPILDAIEDGWLVPIRQRVVETSIDLSAVRRSRGDFSKADLSAVMSQIDALHEIAEPTVDELAGDKQAIVFAVTVEHAHLLAEAIREVITARCGTPRVEVVTGTTPDDERRDIFAGFRAGAHVVQVLVNVEVATEGTDLPSASLIVMARPTQSRALFTQCLGRGTRPLPGCVDDVDAASMRARIEAGEFDLSQQPIAEAIARESAAIMAGDDAAARRLSIALSAKPHMLLLDFAANSGKHALASGVDALEGDALDDELAKEVRKILAEGEQDLIEAIRLARERRAGKTRALRARGGDPFALFGLPEPEPDRWARAMTQDQAAVLQRAGMPTKGLDLRQASAAISAIVERSRKGLATYKQCKALHKFGCPLEVVETVTLKRATELIDYLASEKWRPASKHWWAVPPGISPGANGSAPTS